jgi:TIR domain
MNTLGSVPNQPGAAQFMRDMLFVSHANPEDNPFALWLTLRLAADGYPVWCDLTKFLGGEDFWKDAETAIRTRTCKYLYVLSRTSNTKDGPRNELQVAANVAKANSLHDFIIPVHVDDLPYGEINVLLAKLIAIPFETGWAKGYQQLLDNLERERIPKKTNFGPQAVTSWWRQQFSPERGVSQAPEKYVSNWFPIKSVPALHLHTLQRSTVGRLEPEATLPYANFMDGLDLVTFASAKDMEGKLGPSISIASSRCFSHEELLKTSCDTTGLTTGKARYLLSRLLRDAWDRWMTTLGLGMYTLSDKANCFFFKRRDSDNLDIPFRGIDGKTRYRSVVGYKTMLNGSKRFWHFGIDAQPVHDPIFGFRLASHVLFSDNGQTVWTDHRRMHRARRNQCKDWHNPEWRDRLLAVVAWLSQQEAMICVPVGEEAKVEVSAESIGFPSPVSFADPPTLKERLAEIEEEGEEERGDEEEDDEIEPEDEGH